MWCSRPQGVAIVEYTLLNSCYAPRPGTIKRNVSIHLSTIILSISIYKLKRHRYETSTVTVDSWTVEQRQSLFWCNIFASMRCNKTERDRERQTESEADLWAPITCGGVHIVHRCPHLCCSGGEEASVSTSQTAGASPERRTLKTHHANTAGINGRLRRHTEV